MKNQHVLVAIQKRVEELNSQIATQEMATRIVKEELAEIVEILNKYFRTNNEI